MVASTVPARTNWPVSTVRVLMMPATWGRTSERCRFCLRDPEGGLRHVHGRAEARVLALRARQLLHRQEVVLGQGLAAPQVGRGAVLLRPGLLEHGLRPLGLQPVPVGVDPQEHRPGAHPVALAEAHVGRDAVHLGRDLDHVPRLDLAERLDLVDDVLDGDGGDPDAEGRALLPGGGGVAAAAAGGGERWPPRGRRRKGASGSRGSSLMKPGPVRGEEARAGRDRRFHSLSKLDRKSIAPEVKPL